MKTAPTDFSEYKRTHNVAIDLVAQAAGYAKISGRPVKAFILKPASYELFRAGLEVLMKKELDRDAELTFENTPVRKGTRMQFETLVIEWAPIPVNLTTDN
jgi:hypothetical protein